jgi:hypothetical protein
MKTIRIIIFFLNFGFLCVTQAKVDPNFRSVLQLGNITSNNPIFFWSGSGPTNLAPIGTFVQVLAQSETTDGEFIQLPRETPKIFVVGEPFNVPGIWGELQIDVDYLLKSQDERMANFIVRAWRGAETWDAAVNDPNAFIGQSGVFTRELNAAFPITRIQDPVDLAPPSFTVVPVPEPSVIGLLGVGVLSLSAFRLLRSRSPDGITRKTYRLMNRMDANISEY